MVLRYSTKVLQAVALFMLSACGSSATNPLPAPTGRAAVLPATPSQTAIAFGSGAVSTVTTLSATSTSTTTLTSTATTLPTVTASITSSPTPTLMVPVLELIKPEDRNDQILDCQTLVEGTYSGEAQNKIWLIVYVVDIARYYPHGEGGKALQVIDGKWFGSVRFGDCSNLSTDQGKKFQLIIATATQQANNEFEAYIEHERATGEYPGLERLPDGIIVLKRITITRK